MEIYDQCHQAFSEKMDLANYLNDSMNFHATSHLLLKSRHRLLVPLLSIHLSSKKKGVEYKNSFLKNIVERTDQPVFSVEDAMTQIRKKVADNSTNQMSAIEKAMDEFF